MGNFTLVLVYLCGRFFEVGFLQQRPRVLNMISLKAKMTYSYLSFFFSASITFHHFFIPVRTAVECQGYGLPRSVAAPITDTPECFTGEHCYVLYTWVILFN